VSDGIKNDLGDYVNETVFDSYQKIFFRVPSTPFQWTQEPKYPYLLARAGHPYPALAHARRRKFLAHQA
jgi:hypothetical protein